MSDEPLTPEQRETLAKLLRDGTPFSLGGLFELGRQCAEMIPEPTDERRCEVAAAIDRTTDALAAGDISVVDSVAEVGRLLAEHAQALTTAYWERTHNPNITVH